MLVQLKDVMEINIKSYHSYILIAVTFLLYPTLKGMEVHWQGDTKDYQEAAHVILNGYHQINFRVPFYPVLLILTHSTEKLTTSLFLLQYLLYFLSIVLVVKAMLKSGLKEWHVFIVTLILVSPPLVQMNYHALTEAVSFAMVNILFSIFVLLKRSYKFFLMGLIAAALTLTRPSFQITGLLLTLLFLFIEKNKIRAGFFLVTFLIPLLVFSFFNKNRFDFFGITPASGWHLTTKTASFIDDWPDKKIRPLMIRQRNDNLIKKTSHTGSLFVWSLPRLLQDSLQMNYVQVSKYLMKNNVELIKSNPLRYLSSVGKNFVDYTFPNADSESFPTWARALTLFYNLLICI